MWWKTFLAWKHVATYLANGLNKIPIKISREKIGTWCEMYTANIRSECLVPNAPPRSKDIYIHMQVHAKKKHSQIERLRTCKECVDEIIPRNYTNMQQKIHLSLRLLSNTTVSSTTQPSPEHQIPSNKKTPVLQTGNAMGRWPSGTLFLSRFWLWGNAYISDLMILIYNGSNYMCQPERREGERTGLAGGQRKRLQD